MGKLRGFVEFARGKVAKRQVSLRVLDYSEYELPLAPEVLKVQASRCMDCGIPFCHTACPLGNVIPDFNDEVYRDQMTEAIHTLHSTNNFPEFTGRVCPAPCEASCVLGKDNAPVMIKEVERSIVDRAWELGRVNPVIAPVKTGFRVAIVGSGPAGLTAAQELARRGHDVDVYERDDRLGGLLRYGIPDFKLDKALIDRRLEQLRAEGVRFFTGVHVGVNCNANDLFAEHDAMILCGGARAPRDLPVPGRNLRGVHFAMAFLEQQNRRVQGEDSQDAILATGKKVVIIGGGDTGSDCLGTSIRQGAKSIVQLELMPKPPVSRLDTNPWPEWPLVLRTSSSHEEGGERNWAVRTLGFRDDGKGHVRALELADVTWEGGVMRTTQGTAREIEADLVLLAMGFAGAEAHGAVTQLGIRVTDRGNVKTTSFATDRPGLFAAGDMARGQSLVVWAIADGRKAAQKTHHYLLAKKRRDSLPSPPPTTTTVM